MESGQFWCLSALSDRQIESALSAFLVSGYRTEARIVAHLAELEERKLHLKAGSESLYHYCIHVLRLSNSEAFHRITAARIARKFPVVFSLIEQRQLHLTAICLLRDYLTHENHRELLGEASHKTKWQIEELLARRFPRPDVASRIRKLPTARRVSAPIATADAHTLALPSVGSTPDLRGQRAQHAQAEAERKHHDLSRRTELQQGVRDGHSQVEAALHSQVEAAQSAQSAAGPDHHDVSRRTELQQGVRNGHSKPALVFIEPLSEARYRIQLNASAALKDKLERLRALTSHSNPSGDIARVIEDALDVALQKVEKERFAKTDRPRARRAPKKPRAANSQGAVRTDATKSGSRQRGHVPNAVLREIAERDRLQCSYRSPDGCRCTARGFLEVHHEQPWACGGQETTDNLRLLCRAHNQLLAERDFGSRKVEIERAERQRGALVAASPRSFTSDGGAERRGERCREHSRAGERSLVTP